MKRILLTGISGVGKSTVTNELAARGYYSVDLDTGNFSQWVAFRHSPDIPGTPVEPDRDWVWREDRIQALLATEVSPELFVSGCAPNMRKFLPQFNTIILLRAPAEVIIERLGSRTNNAYGRRPEEVTRVLDLLESVEPHLRKAAGYEIDTSAPLDEVVASILGIVMPAS